MAGLPSRHRGKRAFVWIGNVGNGNEKNKLGMFGLGQTSTSLQILLNSIRYSFSLIGFCTNILLIWIIFSTKLRLHQCNLYMALLAIADIVIAIGLFIRATYAIYASSIGIILYSRWICVLVNTPMGIGFTMTRIAVLAMAADRLYMVIHPLTYNSKFNKSLFAFVLSIDFVFAIIDTFFKFYGIEEKKPILLCSMGSAEGPGAKIFGQFYSNICLVLLFALYIPFLVIYRRKCSQNGLISSSWNWRRQFEVTATTIWLLFFYAFLWGGSFSCLLFVNLFTENGTFYAGYITYIFGFISSACSSASFFVYLRKHPDIQKQTRILLARIFHRNGQQYLGNKVFFLHQRSSNDKKCFNVASGSTNGKYK